MVPEKLAFSPLGRRQIEADFSGGHISSDAGLLLLREVDKRHGLTRQLAGALNDSRMSSKVRHSLHSMVAQRVYGLAAGYEDFNDHQQLRFDQILQSAIGRDQSLAGKSTLSRMERSVDRQSIVEAHRVLWQQFIDQHERPPKELILDFDGTDIPLHGDQPDKHFHRYYDHHCYRPLYVFCGRHLLVSYLRPSYYSDARHSWAILALLVRFIRQHWPSTRIVFRGDPGFYGPRLLNWCDRNGLDYLVGFSKNSKLLSEAEVPMTRVREYYEQGGEKLAVVYRFRYRAKSWKRPRWIVSRLEHGEFGANPRFIISSRYDDGFKLYYQQYCARGDMENRIKDQQLDLFADRSSSTDWWANQWRLLLSGFAYTLFERLRRHLKNTAFKRMSIHNLRLKLIKVAAVVIRNTRRLRLMISENYPWKDELSQLVGRLVPT